jgi:hypothetical protein
MIGTCRRAPTAAAPASPATETSVAMTNCNNGRAAEAIPVLEKVLRANGFRVPERAVARQPQ